MYGYMNIKQAHQPTTNPAPATWNWSAAESVLPTGLPAGALTVIRIRTSETANRDWDNTVADLVRTTLATGRHVGYVPVDSDNPHQAIGKVAVRKGEGGRLGILLDQDHLVTVRDDRGLSRTYGTGVPTLHRVQAQVGGWEDDYGQSLVVLDGLEKARPYAPTDQDLVTFPDGITITRRALNEWRSLEMQGYAHSRPHAPTVVVWHDHGCPYHQEAVELLCDVAMVIVEAHSSDNGDVLTVSQRSHMDQRFPYQKAVYLD
ncbi:MAG TPA: hypothetical protein VGN48_16845 [Pedococcus sp.]|jgi:hypothetical protein|nr:hypothetical protein [Pedococcus sp.]